MNNNEINRVAMVQSAIATINNYSTVTLLAKFLGWSTFSPFSTAT